MLTAVLLVALAADVSPPRDVSQPPARGEGTRVADAPVDLSESPEVLEVSSGLVWLTLGDGTANPGATKVPRGFYLTAAGWHNLTSSYERDLESLRTERAARREMPVPCVPVAPPVVASQGGVSLPVVLVGVGGLLLGGYAGCRAAGGCR